MTEREWVKSIIPKIQQELILKFPNIKIIDGYKVPYSSEILTYKKNEPGNHKFISYETDILIFETINKEEWKPRIIIETKYGSLSTHDAITYSQKAQNHKTVHPYLRYGILLGNMKKECIPGRLFRHGHNFDFMQTWKASKADKDEWSTLIKMLLIEIQTSIDIEEIILNSRKHTRNKYTAIQKILTFHLKA